MAAGRPQFRWVHRIVKSRHRCSLPGFERKTGARAEKPFQCSPDRKSGDNVARPMRQDDDARQRKATATVRTIRRGPGVSAPAADASAPMCNAWPDGNASSRLPEKDMPWTWPITVVRSGRVWFTRSFIPWGKSDAANATSTAWFAARCVGSLRPREASQPTATRAHRTFSSAPQVRARASFSGAGPVLRATVRARATSAWVGRTVNGERGGRRKLRFPVACRIRSKRQLTGAFQRADGPSVH